MLYHTDKSEEGENQQIIFRKMQLMKIRENQHVVAFTVKRNNLETLQLRNYTKSIYEKSKYFLVANS